MKKEEKKQIKYYELKDQYSREFSELMIQRLGLESNGEMNTLVFDDIYIYGLPLPLTYDGYKFVSFDYIQIAEENPDKIKVFDPYNDLGLANYCVLQIMQYIQDIDVNNAVSIISISNNKMNEDGHFELIFNHDFDGKYEYISDPNTDKLIGHNYNRDSLKYLDLIYVLDGAADIEFVALKNIDLVNYDKFELD